MKKKIRLYYGSQQQDIDANTLTISLMSISAAIEDINNYLNSTEGTDHKVSMRINSISQGSFVLDITLIQALGENLVALLGASGGVVPIVDLLANIMNIVAFLRGREPHKVEKQGDKYKITNQYNAERIITINEMNVYMGCTKAREAIAKNNEVLADDIAVTDFTVMDADRELSRVDKDIMTEAIKAPELADSESIRFYEETEWSTAIRLSYNPLHKWTLVYRGIQITARIEDEKFWQRVDNNEAFCKGDSFLVRLKIKQYYDYQKRAWLNKDYCVVEVQEHKRAEAQAEI